MGKGGRRAVCHWEATAVARRLTDVHRLKQLIRLRERALVMLLPLAVGRRVFAAVDQSGATGVAAQRQEWHAQSRPSIAVAYAVLLRHCLTCYCCCLPFASRRVVNSPARGPLSVVCCCVCSVPLSNLLLVIQMLSLPLCLFKLPSWLQKRTTSWGCTDQQLLPRRSSFCSSVVCEQQGGTAPTAARS